MATWNSGTSTLNLIIKGLSIQKNLNPNVKIFVEDNVGSSGNPNYTHNHENLLYFFNIF